MKVLIISDSHGNIANLKHVMGFGKEIEASAVIHCGDWNNVESVETVLSYKIPLYSVLGNADISPEVERILADKCRKFDRVFLQLELGGKTVGLIHDIKKLGIDKRDLDIIFFGHWQKQKEISWNGIRAVNPGALENEINFAVYNTTSGDIFFHSENDIPSSIHS